MIAPTTHTIEHVKQITLINRGDKLFSVTEFIKQLEDVENVNECFFKSEDYYNGDKFSVWRRIPRPKKEYQKLFREYEVHKAIKKNNNRLNEAKQFLSQLGNDAKLSTELAQSKAKLEEIKLNNRIPPERKLGLIDNLQHKIDKLAKSVADASEIANTCKELSKTIEKLKIAIDLGEASLQTVAEPVKYKYEEYEEGDEPSSYRRLNEDNY